MIEALRESWALSVGLFSDGFLALLVAAVALPPLGALLALRRMPFMTIAVPALAGAGVSLSYFLFPLLFAVSSEPPPTWVQNCGALVVLILSFVWLARKGRREAALESSCAVLFVVALAASELLLIESPYAEIADQWLHHGRVLSVLPEGRNVVVLSVVLCALVAFFLRRELWLTALDRDQAQLAGLSPGLWTFLLLLVIGSACSFVVPVLGPDVVLALLLIPATLIRSVAGSLSSYTTLCAGIGLLSAAAAFPLAVGRDWTVAPSLVCVLLVFGLLARLLVGLRSRSR